MSLNSTVYMSQFGNKFILFLDFNVQLYSAYIVLTHKFVLPSDVENNGGMGKFRGEGGSAAH